MRPRIFLLLFWAAHLRAIDIFCGKLTVYEQQRFDGNSFILSSQATDDLKGCLEICCNIPNCQGVTLLGIITPRPGEPNCLLFGCRGGDCSLSAKGNFNDGLISVVLARDLANESTTATAGMDSRGHLISGSSPLNPRPLTYTTAATILIPETFEKAPSMVPNGLYPSPTPSLPISAYPPLHQTPDGAVIVGDHDNNAKMTKALQPVWAVGLAIVIAVCCVGLSLGLLSAYICYRRQKNRKQRAEITQPKMPTLHAFNTAY
ncbi:unnamed protein product, partial [Mesorhabditis belari]|uniref:MANSC domain-containing protein n=1 Tax=Mesorhabditis belari TaxID=2138241 RepID=A0AAF3F116_9BILA